MTYTDIDRFSKIETDPFRGFRFRAQFVPANGKVFNDRVTGFKGGFQMIDGLGISVAPLTYREGGFNTTYHKLPGMATFGDITFSRGVIAGNDEAITWMRGLFTATAGEGLALSKGKTPADFRCNIKIWVHDHPNAAGTENKPVFGIVVRNAWITSLNFTPLNAGENQLFYENMTLTHEGLGVFYSDANGKPKDNSGVTPKFEGITLP